MNNVIIEVKLLWLLLGNLRKIVYTIIPIVSNLVILKQLAQSVRYSKNVLQKEIDKSEKLEDRIWKIKLKNRPNI